MDGTGEHLHGEMGLNELQWKQVGPSILMELGNLFQPKTSGYISHNRSINYNIYKFMHCIIIISK